MKQLLAMMLLLGMLAGPAMASPLGSLSDGDKRKELASMAKGLSSTVIPGLGQSFNDDTTKGWVHFGLGLGLAGAFFLPTVIGKTEVVTADKQKTYTYDLSLIGGVLALANVTLHLYSGLDAYQVSDQIKKKKDPF